MKKAQIEASIQRALEILQRETEDDSDELDGFDDSNLVEVEVLSLSYLFAHYEGHKRCQ
jgi:hypothetical protein